MSTGKPPTHPLTPTAATSALPSPNGETPSLKSDSSHDSLANYGATASSSALATSNSPTPTLPPTANRPSHTSMAASTSFFGIPLSFSTYALRQSLSAQFNSSTEDPEDSIDYLSLYVIYFVTLTAEAARGLLLPSTWPYFHSLGGLKASLGVFVATFSLGRMFSSIPLGFLSDNFSIRIVLIVASIFQIVGHIIYALAPSLPILFASRLIVGFGSSTMAVCRAHLTRAVPARHRTHHFAYLSGLQFIGFAVLPGFGGLMAKIPTFSFSAVLKFNAYTYPAYFLAVANILCIIAVQMFYLDPLPTRPRNPNIRSASLQRLNTIDMENHSPDTFAIVVCLILNIVFRGVIAEFETISIPFMMEQYGISFSVGSYYLSAVGFLGLIVYLSFKPISYRFSDRLLIFAGLSFIVLGCLPLSLPYIASRLPLFVYVLFLGLTWSIAYPIGQTAVLSLFSKILYGLPAGGLLGVFSASGSVARLFMAILASEIWNRAGKGAVFSVIVAYVLVAIGLATISYTRLKPRTPFWA